MQICYNEPFYAWYWFVNSLFTIDHTEARTKMASILHFTVYINTTLAGGSKNRHKTATRYKWLLWYQWLSPAAEDCSISIVNALEILQSCTKPSIWYRFESGTHHSNNNDMHNLQWNCRQNRKKWDTTPDVRFRYNHHLLCTNGAVGIYTDVTSL